VAILGTGYGGVVATASLCKEREYCDITLVDQSSHMELIQQISYLVLGTKDTRDVTVRVDDLFRKEIGDGQVEFVEALVKSIDLDNKIITLSK
jgi:NADH dehydrogenase FAD-containing subunit